MTTGLQQVADEPRRTHDDLFVICAYNFVLFRTDGKRPGVHEMVRRDSVARDDRHREILQDLDGGRFALPERKIVR